MTLCLSGVATGLFHPYPRRYPGGCWSPYIAFFLLPFSRRSDLGVYRRGVPKPRPLQGQSLGSSAHWIMMPSSRCFSPCSRNTRRLPFAFFAAMTTLQFSLFCSSIRKPKELPSATTTEARHCRSTQDGHPFDVHTICAYIKTWKVTGRFAKPNPTIGNMACASRVFGGLSRRLCHYGPRRGVERRNAVRNDRRRRQRQAMVVITPIVEPISESFRPVLQSHGRGHNTRNADNSI